MNPDEEPIMLIKERGFINFINILFVVLAEESETEFNDFIKNKTPSEIAKLKINIQALKNKIDNWLDDGKKYRLELLKEEAVLFRMCASISYCFLTKNKQTSLSRKRFIEHYHTYLKNK